MIRDEICIGTKKQVRGDIKNIEILNRVFGNVELTEEEERTLIWLSTWETSTVKNIVDVVNKIK